MSTVRPADLVKRINRRLAADGHILRTTRGDRWRDLGDFYEIDTRHNVIATHVDIEALGRDVGALQASEVLA